MYGPSICTRFVQMDRCRNHVRRPFPTPGSGTLWVAGESLRDRRVCCLLRWTVCPTRSPSQDTNRSTCRGECSWSGPLATPPGRCHLGPLANGPGRNPPYCLRSGGAHTDTGGAPKPPRSGTSPAFFAGSCHPAPPPPPFAAVLVPASPLSSPVFPAFPHPFPCSLVPAVPRPSLLSFPALVLCVAFFFCRALAAWRPFRLPPVSPPGVVVCPPPPPLSPRWPRPVLGWVGVRGLGGGALAVCLLASAALVPLLGGAGLPCGPLRRPSFPVFAPPVAPPSGACSARAPYAYGLVVPHPLSAASPPCRFVRGGHAFCPPLPSSTTLGGGGVCGGGGAPVVFSPVARMLQARCKHDASTRRGTWLQWGGAPLFGLPAVLLGTGSAPQDLRSQLPLGGSRHISARCSVSRACSLLCPYLLEEVRTWVDSEDEELRAAGRTYRTPRRFLAPSNALVEGRAPVSAPSSPGGADCPSSPWCLCIHFRVASYRCHGTVVPWYCKSAGSGGYKAAGRSRPPGLCHPRARWRPLRSCGRDAGRRAGDSFVATPGHLVKLHNRCRRGPTGWRRWCPSPLRIPLAPQQLQHVQGAQWMAPLARVPSAPQVGPLHGRPYGWRRRCLPFPCHFLFPASGTVNSSCQRHE